MKSNTAVLSEEYDEDIIYDEPDIFNKNPDEEVEEAIRQSIYLQRKVI